MIEILGNICFYSSQVDLAHDIFSGIQVTEYYVHESSNGYYFK